MTCPHCHVNSRFSDLCTNCGARLGGPSAKVEDPSSTDTRGNEPNSTSPSPWTRRAELSPIQTRKRLRPGRSPFQWSVPAFLLVLGLAACAGRGVRQLYLMNNKVALTQAIPASLPDTSEPFGASTSGNPIALSNGKEVSGIQDQETPPAIINFRPEDELATPELLASLHPALDSDVPFLAYSPSTRPLQLENSRPVSAALQEQITQNYRNWKWRQSEDTTHITRFLNFYAPDARIFCTPGREMSRGEFYQMVLQMREAGYFTSVYDQKPLRWAQNSAGNEMEMLAFHVYSDDSGNRLWGQRRLIWQKRGNQWLIIRDDFPPRYFSRDEKTPTWKMQEPLTQPGN